MLPHLCTVFSLVVASAVAQSSQIDRVAAYKKHAGMAAKIRGAMIGSIRTSWEQGTAAEAVLQQDNPEYSVFGDNPFQTGGNTPVTTLQFALSASVRQSGDGRLSQLVGDGADGAALDGASAGPHVVLGTYTDSNRKSYWQSSADAQLNYLLNTAPRTSTGAISHRSTAKEYWADGMFMGFPFLAIYGAVADNQTIVQNAYDQCRLYRDALLIDGPTGKLWAHIFSDDTQQFSDQGLWGTGNGWAALGMQHVQAAILKSQFASSMTAQTDDLSAWIKEILDGTFAALTSDNLVPDYVSGGANFGDASASAALAAVAFRGASLDPSVFTSNYTDTAVNVANAVLSNVDNLGIVSPLVDPINWGDVGSLSTEGQAFSLMMLAAWRDWVGA
ncbi:Six-hairpin glycosidase [Rickenella mellea]|uniref:Six-hairpin glycosidase n=1 Tax=Rickenella mellea TaxID=50990 RepID=A0A4Y7Q3B0_9AGAM|nr:Six-hairpin glycosidase [Rickenella mellea]